MDIKLINASEVKGKKEVIEEINKDIRKEIGKRVVKDVGNEEKKEKRVCITIGTSESFEHMTILPADKIIKCERREIGLLSNCATCERLNNDFFLRCRHKYTDY